MKLKSILILVILMAIFIIFSQSALAEDSCYDCEPCYDCGTGTPGYWKNHPEAWPVNEVEIGGIVYTVEEAIARMNEPVRGDKANTMFNALVAAWLNYKNGCEAHCIAAVGYAAFQWMDDYDGDIVRANSAAWKCGEWLYLTLDAYNNGYLCAPSRDTLE